LRAIQICDKLKVSKSLLESFFKSAETARGVFSPKGYLLAVFGEGIAALQAETALRNSGITEDEVIAVSGNDMLRYTQEHVQNDGLIGGVMRELSRFFGTEALYTDNDVKLASAGAWFLLVHCPTEKAKHGAWALIQPLKPLVARHYEFGGIDHLAGEAYQ
jgi:hypothetical protein